MRGKTTSTLCGMSSVSASVRTPSARFGRVLERVSEESPLIAVVGLFATFVAASAAPYMIIGDTWLTFLGGREIAQHGIPGIDALTVLSHGRMWVDQQWLAQLASYHLESTFGLRATLAVFAAMVVAPFVIACWFARNRGASPRSVAIFAVLAAPAALCAVRAQAFSYLLFAPFLALLAAESRRPTRRVWLALPVLALWANLHGAVLVAAALVSLLGFSELVGRRSRARGLALLLLPWPCLFASPYGLSLVDYYRSTLDNPLFKKYVLEWTPPIFPSAVGLPFFLAAGLAIVLVARRPRDLTFFEGGALLLTLLGALTAQRSIVWFSYTALLLLPAVLGRASPQPAAASYAVRRVLGLAAFGIVAIGLATAGVAAAHASAGIDSLWPKEALRTVRAVVAADPHARVVGAEGSADWLLYEIPELRGRIAFDGRFEVLSQGQFQSVRDYLKQSGPDWQRFSRGYRIVVVDPERNSGLYRFYRSRGLRILYGGSRVAVFER
jgi:hypothetical protein